MITLNMVNRFTGEEAVGVNGFEDTFDVREWECFPINTETVDSIIAGTILDTLTIQDFDAANGVKTVDESTCKDCLVITYYDETYLGWGHFLGPYNFLSDHYTRTAFPVPCYGRKADGTLWN